MSGMTGYVAVCGVVFLTVFVGGCSPPQSTGSSRGGTPEVRTVRLHIDGFQKSKSGAV
jgi:hypothetical protein